MTRRGNWKRVDPGEARGYLDTGRMFLRAAQALGALAGGDELYGNAIAVLAVHSAISHADAACIARAGKKSTGGDHRELVSLLRDVFGNRLPSARERDLRSLLEAKDHVSYQGEHYLLSDALNMLQRAVRMAGWVDGVMLEL